MGAAGYLRPGRRYAPGRAPGTTVQGSSCRLRMASTPAASAPCQWWSTAKHRLCRSASYQPRHQPGQGPASSSHVVTCRTLAVRNRGRAPPPALPGGRRRNPRGVQIVGLPALCRPAEDSRALRSAAARPRLGGPGCAGAGTLGQRTDTGLPAPCAPCVSARNGSRAARGGGRCEGGRHSGARTGRPGGWSN